MPDLLSGPFYFLRHGESTTNRDGTIAGSLDPPLTARGREQAQAAAEALRNSELREIISSPKRRALDTAEVVAERLRLPVRLVDDLRERHWGALEGRPIAERTSHAMLPDGGEGWESFAARVWAAVQGLSGEAPTLLVAHAGVMLVLQDRLAGVAASRSVANALPVRFEPPARPGDVWRLLELPAGADGHVQSTMRRIAR